MIESMVYLGQRVARLTRHVEANSRSFAVIAARSIEETRLPRVTFDELLRDSLDLGRLPAQRRVDDGFGQPSITVYRNSRFTVDLLFWHTATTGIHQHQFAGAFGVLYGSSLHTTFEFQRRTSLCPALKVGSLRVASVEILATGAVRPIWPGRGLIHSLFHLDSPSVTLAVRSLPKARSAPEYEFIPPNVAIDPRARDGAKSIYRQLLSLGMRFCPDDFADHLGHLLVSSDIHGAFLLLSRARAELRHGPCYRRLVRKARLAHGAVIDQLLPAIDEQCRRMDIVALRSVVENREHRLFIALLLNLPDYRAIIAALSSLNPLDDHSGHIVRLIGELSAYDWFDLPFDDTHETILRELLRNTPLKEMTAQKRRPAVRKVHSAYSRSPMFGPLFR